MYITQTFSKHITVLSKAQLFLCISFRNEYVPFHLRGFDYSCADWDGFLVISEIFHGRISLIWLFLLPWLTFELVQIGIYIHTHHGKYRVNFYSSPWFSAAYAATFLTENSFLCVSCKIVFEFVQLACTDKRREFLTFKTFDFLDFFRIANSNLSQGKTAVSPVFKGP